MPAAVPSLPRSRSVSYWPYVKWSLFAVVLLFVLHRAAEVMQTAPREAFHVDGRWLIPATLLSILAWIPSIVFWRAMIVGCGFQPPWFATIRAYYIGGLGKYVPGKAMVLILRAALLKPHGVRVGVSAVTAGYETLATMGAGAGLAVALAPFATSPIVWDALPVHLRMVRDQVWLLPLAVVLVTVMALPVIARLFTLIASKMTPRAADDDSPPVKISTGMLLKGLGIVLIGWLLLAVSLGCVLAALKAGEFSGANLPTWLAAVSIATVGGFVVLFAPGGLGVREALLASVLRADPEITPVQAELAAWLLRGVCLAGELVAAGLVASWQPRTGQDLADSQGQ